jgi:3-oxoacyl-[acyl-carrier-protein] synthase-1
MPWGLVGGVESWLEPETIEWLEADERLHSAANPWGLIPGEGAAFSAVSDPANTPELRGGLATLGFGVASESVPRRGAEPCLGIGLTAAMQEALTSVPDGEQVDEMFCDCNGERDRAEEFGFAVIRVSDRFVDASAMRTPADCWGDVGCATGAMLLALSYQAAARGWLAGPNMLLWSSSDGPQRAAAALRAHFRQKEI